MRYPLFDKYIICPDEMFAATPFKLLMEYNFFIFWSLFQDV